MIVKMKKISIVVKSSWMDDVLNTLGEIGIVHLLPVNSTENDIVLGLKEKIQLLKKALSIVPEKYYKNVSVPFDENEKDGLLFAKQIVRLVEEQKHLEGKINILMSEFEALKVWGRFAPEEIIKLREKGLSIKLFKCRKKEFGKISKKHNIYIISKDNSYIYFTIISTENNINIPLEELDLPEYGIADIETMIREVNEKLSNIQNENSDLYNNALVIMNTLQKSIEVLYFEEAKAGMGPSNEISYLQGFCPGPEIDRLREAAGQRGWAILIESPAQDGLVPTLLKHSKWTGMFQPVMDFIGVIPGYREFDTNGVFLIFFSIFFAMIIGDGGYGIVFLITTFLLGRFYKRISKEKILLLYLVSITTIIWGAVTGLWFGVESINHLPVLKELIIPSLYSFSRENENNIIQLCFLIGAVQLTIARTWVTIKLWPSLPSYAEIGWIALIWGMYYIVRTLLLNEKLSIIVFFLIGFWVCMLVVFGEQRGDGFIKGTLRGIVGLPVGMITGIGCLSDIISYIRLFAVGLATKEIAMAFNNLAWDVGFNGILPVIAAIFILVLGHTINILLGGMSVMVHGIRLNLLEFSRHLNIQWTGISYNPFKLRITNVAPNKVSKII